MRIVYRIGACAAFLCVAACADDRPSRPLSPQMYDLLANPVPGPVPGVQPVFVMNPRRY